MKVYIVHWTDYDGEEIIEKGFFNQDDARAFVEHKNKTTDFGWFHQEVEVEE
jgi:hypothetical protein